MKFRIQQSILSNALAALQPFLEKKDASQMASHILIRTVEDGIWLSATDNIKGLTLFVSAKIEIKGMATANGTKLNTSVNALNGDVTIERVKDVVFVRSGRSKLKLDSFDESQYPEFPKVNEKDESLSIKAIMDAKRVAFSADETHPKAMLQGVFIGDDIVGSNGHIMTLINNTEMGVECIIPKSMVNAIANFSIEKRHITIGKTNITDRSLTHFMFSRVINDKYPNYKNIMNQNSTFDHSISIPKNDLIEALMLCKISDDKVLLKFEGSSIEFCSLDPNRSVKTSIEVDTVEGVEIALNIGYVLGFLREIKGEYKMEFNREYGAVRFSSGDLSCYIMSVVVA